MSSGRLILLWKFFNENSRRNSQVNSPVSLTQYETGGVLTAGDSNTDNEVFNLQLQILMFYRKHIGEQTGVVNIFASFRETKKLK